MITVSAGIYELENSKKIEKTKPKVDNPLARLIKIKRSTEVTSIRHPKGILLKPLQTLRGL